MWILEVLGDVYGCRCFDLYGPKGNTQLIYNDNNNCTKKKKLERKLTKIIIN